MRRTGAPIVALCHHSRLVQRDPWPARRQTPYALEPERDDLHALRPDRCGNARAPSRRSASRKMDARRHAT